MLVQYSTQRESLAVKFNSEMQADYTAAGSALPSNEPMAAQLGMPGPFYPPPAGFPGMPPGFPGQMPPMGQPPPGYMGQPGPMMHQMPPPPSSAQSQSQLSPVLVVKGLHEEVTVDGLFKLFGVYGDVEKLKIVWDKRDTALIQFTTRQGAECAAQNLHGAILFGNRLDIKFFKNGEVNVTEDRKGELAEYYGRNHPLHRFGKNQSNNSHLHICPPTDTLHVSSIPNDWDDAKLRSVLSPAGRVLSVKFLTAKRYQQAVVNMGSVQEAMNVIMMFHWMVVEKDIGENSKGKFDLNMRVNFCQKETKSDDAAHRNRHFAQPPMPAVAVAAAAAMPYGYPPQAYNPMHFYAMQQQQQQQQMQQGQAKAGAPHAQPPQQPQPPPGMDPMYAAYLHGQPPQGPMVIAARPPPPPPPPAGVQPTAAPVVPYQPPQQQQQQQQSYLHGYGSFLH